MLILDIVVILLLLATSAAVLGTMREVVILQSKVAAFTDLLLNPPGPVFIDGLLPDVVRAALLKADGVDTQQDIVVLFLRKGCSGCHQLLQGIKNGVSRGDFAANQIVGIVAEKSRGDLIETTLAAVGATPIIDYGRTLASACQVKQTPTLLHLEANSLQVIDTTVGGNFQWLQSRLFPSAADLTY